jgi:hypothetical protein
MADPPAARRRPRRRRPSPRRSRPRRPSCRPAWTRAFCHCSFPNLLYMENTYSYKKCRWRITARPRISTQASPTQPQPMQPQPTQQSPPSPPKHGPGRPRGGQLPFAFSYANPLCTGLLCGRAKAHSPKTPVSGPGRGGQARGPPGQAAAGGAAAGAGRLGRGPSVIAPLQSPLHGESLWSQEIMEDPYSHKKCRWRVTARPRLRAAGARRPGPVALEPPAGAAEVKVPYLHGPACNPSYNSPFK